GSRSRAWPGGVARSFQVSENSRKLCTTSSAIRRPGRMGNPFGKLSSAKMAWFMHGGRNDDDQRDLTITLNFRRRPFRWKSALTEFRGEFGRGMEAGGPCRRRAN